MAKFSRIRINNVGAGGSTAVAVNGEVRHIPHNADAVVDEYFLEALENSHVDITVVGSATKAQADKAGASAGTLLVDAKAAPYEQPVGGDFLPKPPPEEELDVRASAANTLGGEPYTQPTGGDYLLKTPDVPLAPSDEDREAAIKRRDDFEAGDIEPVVELTNLDPHQIKLQSAGGPIDATGLAATGKVTGEARAPAKAKKAKAKASPAARRVLPVEERGEEAKGLLGNLKTRLGKTDTA